MCGEQIYSAQRYNYPSGSSPRVRGTGYWTRKGSEICRFIPACAGNSIAIEIVALGVPVHPRVCGEQRADLLAQRRRNGSSPRVRGTAESELRRLANGRFIPACAGNRSTRVGASTCEPVHPRVCGEQFSCVRVSIRELGSSPRVRGTDWKRSHAPPAKRFIPACAGNRIIRCSTTRKLSVHPRVCGEQQVRTSDETLY